MIIDIQETETKILSLLTELCEEQSLSFARYAHPGSLMTLGWPINGVTVLVRFVGIDNPRPDNLNSPCVSIIPDVKFEIHTVHIDYRTHSKIYDLAKEISKKLRGRRDILQFCPDAKDTQMGSFIEDFRFLEIDSKDYACYSYSFDLVIPYAESYSNRRV